MHREAIQASPDTSNSANWPFFNRSDARKSSFYFLVRLAGNLGKEIAVNL